MADLSGKTALITGASRGIGAATARHLASGGVKLVLAARSTDEIERLATEIREAGGEAVAQQADVSIFANVARAVSRATAEFGRLDILVNNAGLIDPIARIADSDPASWGRIVDVNYKGVYHGLRAAIPVMLEGGGGTVVNLSSGAATSALEGWSHYCSTKAAVLSLTRCAHRECGEQGIRVVGLSPGTVATDMQVSIRDSGINPVSQLPESAHIPPEWVARAIGFLCGPGGEEYAGADFSLKDNDGRAKAGLPPVAA